MLVLVFCQDTFACLFACVCLFLCVCLFVCCFCSIVFSFVCLFVSLFVHTTIICQCITGWPCCCQNANEKFTTNKYFVLYSCSIGVTTGRTFCGVVGHPKRQEFTGTIDN